MIAVTATDEWITISQAADLLCLEVPLDGPSRVRSREARDIEEALLAMARRKEFPATETAPWKGLPLISKIRIGGGVAVAQHSSMPEPNLGPKAIHPHSKAPLDQICRNWKARGKTIPQPALDRLPADVAAEFEPVACAETVTDDQKVYRVLGLILQVIADHPKSLPTSASRGGQLNDSWLLAKIGRSIQLNGGIRGYSDTALRNIFNQAREEVKEMMRK